MKKTRGLSLIVCIAMLLGVLNFSVYAAENTITAYITISMCGEIVKDKNGDFVAEKPVTLSGKESYNLDDAFYEAHELYYEGGAEAGYASELYTSSWGSSLSITKAWGDTSTKFGYQMNLGTTSVMGLEQTLTDGDYIDLCIYENYYPDTENYAYFDVYNKAVSDEKTELTLMESYYDNATWAKVDVPCVGASILINGEETGIKTDENGKFSVVFYKSGEYTVTAKKMKTLVNAVTGEDNLVSARTAPVCILSVTLPEEIEIIHNTIENIIKDDVSKNSQIHWLLADIAGYKELYPNSKNILSETEIQNCIDAIIEFADTHIESASDIAKSIIALRSMGYDAKNLYNKNGIKIDLPQVLGEYINNGTNGATSVYALPYIIIAMSEYATPEQKETLLGLATTQKTLWQDTAFGVDGATPMMLALAPYCDENSDVKNAVLEAIDLVKSKQSDSGAVECITDWDNMTWGDSAASTGLAIAGFSAMGTDAQTIVKNGNSLISGIMSLKTGNLDGFLATPFDTEQGLRGLIAWKMAKEGKRIFDFSTYPQNIAYATRRHTGGGRIITENSKEEENEKKISVKVLVMVHNKGECNNSYTYKLNSEKYSELVEKTVEIDNGGTVYDATVKALNESGISFTEDNGYISKIGTYAEFGHGNNSGWMFKLNGKHQNKGSKDITLDGDATVLWFYTDDYTLESGSENYNKPSENEGINKAADEKGLKDEKPIFRNDIFSDVKETDWHYSAVKYVYENNLMSGTEKGFEPDAKMTRAMLVTVLFRLNGGKKTETDAVFNDIENGKWYTDSVLWAASVGIVSGVGDNNFAPDSEITREQMAVILYNFAKYKNQINDKTQNEKIDKFEDFDDVSDYAKDAVSWANGEGFISGESKNTLNPKNTATRAQIASLLMRYCEAE